MHPSPFVPASIITAPLNDQSLGLLGGVVPRGFDRVTVEDGSLVAHPISGTRPPPDSAALVAKRGVIRSVEEFSQLHTVFSEVGGVRLGRAALQECSEGGGIPGTIRPHAPVVAIAGADGRVAGNHLLFAPSHKSRPVIRDLLGSPLDGLEGNDPRERLVARFVAERLEPEASTPRRTRTSILRQILQQAPYIRAPLCIWFWVSPEVASAERAAATQCFHTFREDLVQCSEVLEQVPDHAVVQLHRLSRLIEAIEVRTHG